MRCGVQLTLNGQIRELSEGLFALGQLVNLEKRVSWVPTSVSGFDPSTVYVVRNVNEALVIDTGLRAHRDQVIAQLKMVISSSTKVTVLLTRDEPDCVGNLDALVQNFRVDAVYCGNSIHPLDLLGPYSGLHPGVAHRATRPDTLIVLEGRAPVRLIAPAVRNLPTTWAYDEATATLFSSDFFGSIHTDADWHPIQDLSARAIVKHLSAKFEWLLSADTGPSVKKLDAVFRNQEIRVVAPGHGLWISSASQAQRLYQSTRVAMLSIGTGPPISRG